MATPPDHFQSSTDPIPVSALEGGAGPIISYGSSLVEKLYPVVSPFPKDRPPPEPPIELEEAEIRWGKASNFSFGSRKGPHLKYNMSVKWPDGDGDDEEEEEEETPTLNRTEVEGSRKVSKLRVTSDDDPDIYLEVERIDEITFEGPISPEDPRLVKFKYILKNPPSNT